MAWFRRKPAGGRHALGAAVTSIPSGPLSVVLPAAAAPAPVSASYASLPAGLAPAALEVPAAPSPTADHAVPVVAEPLPASADDLYGSIAQLLATGEAWSAAPPPGVAREAAPYQPAAAPVATGSAAAQLATPAADAPAVLPTPPAEALPPSANPVATALVPAALAPAAPAAAPAPAAPPPRAVAAPATRDVVTLAAPLSARSSLEAALAQLLPLQAGPPTETAPQQAPLRVQLGFRDGTSTTLDPASDQALALEQLAHSLTRRD